MSIAPTVYFKKNCRIGVMHFISVYTNFFFLALDCHFGKKNIIGVIKWKKLMFFFKMEITTKSVKTNFTKYSTINFKFFYFLPKSDQFIWVIYYKVIKYIIIIKLCLQGYCNFSCVLSTEYVFTYMMKGVCSSI